MVSPQEFGNETWDIAFWRRQRRYEMYCISAGRHKVYSGPLTVSLLKRSRWRASMEDIREWLRSMSCETMRKNQYKVFPYNLLFRQNLHLVASLDVTIMISDNEKEIGGWNTPSSALISSPSTNSYSRSTSSSSPFSDSGGDGA